MLVVVTIVIPSCRSAQQTEKSSSSASQSTNIDLPGSSAGKKTPSSRFATTRFFIRGVHRIDAPEPCHLIDVELDEAGDFDWGEVTQENPTQPRSNWQVAYDERPLDDQQRRWAFFFHYLDFSKPLLTPHGEVQIPAATPRPEHLANVDYEPP